MPHARYFSPHSLNIADIVKLSSDEEKHLLKVMRTTPGDHVEIVNGQGILASAVLQKDGQLKIGNIFYQEPSKTKIIIAQAITKSNKLDIILEKGTELGMDELWLFPGDLSEKTEISQTLMTRLESIAISAMKQSGRLYVPKIILKEPLKKWKAPLDLPGYFGDVNPKATPFAKVWDKNSFIFLIGPEKGFSRNEEEILIKLNAKGVKLHSNILRTETAPITLLSIASHLML
jgi:16S rRNA (uracil1498-N3)-methyltransferase